jgi:Poly(3-hydroxybutyrate) depolymerase
MSNGGEMCYQLAAQRPRLFAAVAPVSGLMLEWLYKADTSDVPVPLFEIHGTADRTSAWEGDLDNKGGWGAYVAVPMAVHYWAAKNKCTGMQTDTIPGRTPENGRKVIAHRFTGGTGGSEVWLYEIVGGKHSWGEQDIDTGEELWKFFSKFVK